MTRAEVNKRYRENHLVEVRKNGSKWQRDRRKNNPILVKTLEKLYRKKKIERPIQKTCNKVSWAIESGRIKKPPYCSCCGRKKKLNAHHRDYTRPYDIVWLCVCCHKFLHAYMKRIVHTHLNNTVL